MSRRNLTLGFVAVFACVFAAHADPGDVKVGQTRWRDFPGFSADIEVEWKSKRALGRLVVLTDGRIFLESVPEQHRAWAHQQLTNLICEGLPQPRNEKWNFVLASASGWVHAKNDPFGAACLIQNERVVAVEHRLAGGKIRLTSLKSAKAVNDRPLPIVHVRLHWSIPSGELESTETILTDWQKVGCFDLPASIQTLAAGKQVFSGRIAISGHRLFQPQQIVASR